MPRDDVPAVPAGDSASSSPVAALLAGREGAPAGRAGSPEGGEVLLGGSEVSPADGVLPLAGGVPDAFDGSPDGGRPAAPEDGDSDLSAYGGGRKMEVCVSACSSCGSEGA
ncbi:hypothetical protein ETD86_48700 [Nonomuraea turkmeniaca]|uniref:Uncharacterized protein n=1 Tax=Nonomuraea turkmeniaca TaxID=103838 RepID=A0A5S4EX54_9ACTN|nr:hypothetical protein ETD86_48700 [Nonomuraea turkmeniaca]